VSFRTYNDFSPQEGHSVRPPSQDVYQPGSGENFALRESNENFQQYSDGNCEVLSGLDAYSNLCFPFLVMIGGLDYVRSDHDLQNESDGNHSSLSGGIGWIGDIQMVTPT
jgi:hypothetical protein